MALQPIVRHPNLDGLIEESPGEPGMSVFLDVYPPPPSFIAVKLAHQPVIGGNPQATFMGLPRELRLEIYDRLYPSRLTHVSITGGSRGLGTTCTGILVRQVYNATGRFAPFTFASPKMAPLRLFWRPCMCPDQSLKTCSKPPWSGLCSPEEHCSSTNCHIRYDFNIAATCKTIRREVLHHVLMRVSMPIGTARTILKEFASDFLSHIQHLTLTPNVTYSSYHHDPLFQDAADPSLLRIHQIMTEYTLPSLRSITMQRRVATRKFRTIPKDVTTSAHGYQRVGRYEADPNWLSIWLDSTMNDPKLPKAFPVPIFAEYWVVLQPKDRDLGLDNDLYGTEMLCIRTDIPVPAIITEGNEPRETGSLEVSRFKITYLERRARWKSYWEWQVPDLWRDLWQ